MGRWGLHDDYYRNGFISISTTIFIFQFCLLSKTFFQKEQIVALFWILKEYCFRSKIQLFVALFGEIKILESIWVSNFRMVKTKLTKLLHWRKQNKFVILIELIKCIISLHFVTLHIVESGDLEDSWGYAFSCVCSLFIILVFLSQFSHKRKCFKLSS